MSKVIRVGSRDSMLAVAQSMIILNEIKSNNPDIRFELVTMKTTGDTILDRNLYDIGGKGLFVKELDRALLDGRVDIVIHSLKDLPLEIDEDLPLVGFSKRVDPRDAIIYKKALNSSDSFTGCIGTSSKRRMVQLMRLYPDATFKGIRGNVQTRLKKLENESYDATVLAMAGLLRLGIKECVGRVFSTDEVIPAAGQGILAVQGRKGVNYSFVDCINSDCSFYCAMAERSFVRTLGGSCSSPVAAYAEVVSCEINLKGMYFNEETGRYVTGTFTGSKEDAVKIGEKLAEKLKKKLQREG